VSDRRPLQLDQTALGDLEIMPIADLRFFTMIQHQQNVWFVCVVGGNTDPSQCSR
jgi:hypothetical protein